MMKQENRENSGAAGMTRREAIQMGAGTLLGAAGMLAGAGELASLAAQANVQATPPPATDPRFPMRPIPRVLPGASICSP